MLPPSTLWDETNLTVHEARDRRGGGQVVA
jgi:hypothetical protein